MKLTNRLRSSLDKKTKQNPKMTKSKPKRKHIHKSYENTIDLNNFGMRKKRTKLEEENRVAERRGEETSPI